VGLALSKDVKELGISIDFYFKEDDWALKGDRWYFGEVLPKDYRSIEPNADLIQLKR
jgi:hypothetical protein